MNKELFELSYELKKEFRKKILSILVFLAALIISINLVLSFFVYPVKQVSSSMEPDFVKGSCVMFTYLKKNHSRGEVVIVNKRKNEDENFSVRFLNSFISFITAQRLTLDDFSKDKSGLMGNDCQIRRIIGIPGDSIYMRDYVLYIKPKGEQFFLTEFELVEKNYNVNINVAPGGWDMDLGVRGSFDEITLKDNEYFVLGDSRNSSIDSRLWGPVSKKDIKSSAVFRYFPLNKLKFFLF